MIDCEDPLAPLRAHYNEALEALSHESLTRLRGWEQQLGSITAEQYSYTVRGRAER